jgi:hypothetical protein
MLFGVCSWSVCFCERAGLNGNCATIKRWEKLPDGKFGPIQVHGGVRLNDVVLRVNDVDLTMLPYAQVLEHVHASDFRLLEDMKYPIWEEDGIEIRATVGKCTLILPKKKRGNNSNSFHLSLTRRSQ